MTYLVARAAILDLLTKRGWAVNPRLKIPHATSQDGNFRLWFKAQAVYFTLLTGEQPRHIFNDARTLSYTLDIRKISAVAFVKWVENYGFMANDVGD